MEAIRSNWLHDPHMVGVVANVRDITERKRAEETLTEERSLLRTLIESMPDYIFVKDTQSRFVLNNAEHLRAFGAKKQEEVVGKTDFDVFPEEMAQRYYADEQEVIRSGRPLVNREEPMIDETGKERWNSTTKVPLQDSSGKIVGLVGIARDITERKKIEKALEENRQWLETIVGNMPVVLFALDRQGVFTLSEGKGLEALGLRPGEVVGRSVFEVYRDMPEILERVRRTLGGEEVSLIAEMGENAFETFYAPLRDEVGEVVGVIGVAADVTERKRAEEEMREANRRLSELATLRADFTAMVAHELDTPLAVIRGYADVLATGELEPAEWERALSRIQAETEILNALVGDVRVAASAERKDFVVNPRRVPVGELLNDAVQFVATLSGDHPLVLDDAADAIKRDGVRAGYADPFIFEGADDRREVWADRYRIGQVLRNLLTNAVKYSPEGAPIELRAVPDEAAGRVRIEVIDHGPGIHPDDMERIFEKFGRGRDPEGRKVAGLGLGLYLSRRILRAHGSDLTVDAVPGDGSVFGFDLEAADE